MKPENLLLSDPSESAILKIADFGLSAVVFATEGVEGAFSSPAAHLGCNDNSHFDYLAVGGKPPDGQSHQHVHFNQQSPIQILQSPVAKQHNFSTPPITPSPVILRRLRSVVGSPHYIAPEIVNHGKLDMYLF